MGFAKDIKNIVKKVESLKVEIPKLEKELNKYNRKLQDIGHWIEFNPRHDITAAKRDEIYKLEHKVRKERREIKDKLRIGQSIVDNMKDITGRLQSAQMNIGKTEHSVNNRFYKVRELTEVFGDSL